MKAWKACSILAAGWLAAGCATGQQAPAQVSAEPTAPPAGQPSGSFAAEPSEAPSSDERGGSAESDAAPAPPPAAAMPAPGDAASSRGMGGSARAEASRPAPKKSSPIRQQEERPGLGTTWGETMTSRVSNAPFERASDSPFSLSTVHYNDQSGVAAMLRGGSFVDFRSDGSNNGFLTVRLTDENGSALPTFQSNGRMLVQGEIGQRYMISISNQSSNRFEAVVTVDGLDVIDGRAGSFAKRGYLIQPFGSVEIDGFRQSMDEVAAFRFGSVRGSYAAQKGSDRNVGVIGVAVFAERGARQVWSDREIGRRESADAFPGRFATPAGR